jgi:hypothetical protein
MVASNSIVTLVFFNNCFFLQGVSAAPIIQNVIVQQSGGNAQSWPLTAAGAPDSAGGFSVWSYNTLRNRISGLPEISRVRAVRLYGVAFTSNSWNSNSITDSWNTYMRVSGGFTSGGHWRVGDRSRGVYANDSGSSVSIMSENNGGSSNANNPNWGIRTPASQERRMNSGSIMVIW